MHVRQLQLICLAIAGIVPFTSFGSAISESIEGTGSAGSAESRSASSPALQSSSIAAGSSMFRVARARVATPSQEILAVLPGYEARSTQYQWQDPDFGRNPDRPTADVQYALDRAFYQLERDLIASRFTGGDSSYVHSSFERLRESVQRADLDAALADIDELRHWFEPLADQALATELAEKLERLEDAAIVLSPRFATETTPFAPVTKRGIFAARAEGIRDMGLPRPVSQYADRLDARMNWLRYNALDGEYADVVRSADRFLDAILDGEQAAVTNQLGLRFTTEVAIAESRAGREFARSDWSGLLEDARRFANLFRAGATRPAVPRTTPGETLQTVMGGRLFQRVTSLRPGLQPGYTPEDLAFLVAEVVGRAEKGEDVGQIRTAYDALIRPVLDQPQSELSVSNSAGEFLGERKALLAHLEDLSASRVMH